MCGIAGIIGDIDQGEADRVVDAMLAEQLHRGPDSGGHRAIALPGGAVAFGTRRLAIIELTDLGSQPMVDDATGDVLAFNGEIYNHGDLRAQLRSDGIAFRGRSDTEVLFRALQRWGSEALDRLVGMFTFAIWDAKRGRLTVARDRLGIKPLYVAHVGGRTVFASELRSLLASGQVERKLDRSALESFLAFGSVIAPNTIVEGVQSLLPGHVMELGADGAPDVRRYWSVPFPDADAAAPSDVSSAIAETLTTAVERHLVSDVPVGLFLSGGVDSSCLALLAARGGADLKTFSIDFGEHGFAEGEYARQVAEVAGSDHTEIGVAEADLLALVPDALAAMDQPSYDGVNVFAISKVARAAGVVVVLSGQGGDEIFGGYSTFRAIPALAGPRRAGAAVRASGRAASALLPRRLASSKRLSLMSSASDPFAAYRVIRGIFGTRLRRHLIGRAPDGVADGLPLSVSSRLSDRLADLDPVNQVSALELELFLGNTLLRDGDAMSMAHSIEVRVPLLDDSLVSLVTSLPGALKIRAETPKPLLVDAVADLPRNIYQRPKQGFTFPWSSWMRSGLRARIEPVLGPRDAGAALGMRPGACAEVWNDFLEGRRVSEWTMPWSLFVLLEWCERNGVAL